LVLEFQYCVEMEDKVIRIFRSIFSRLGYRTTYTISKAT
jgi:hypothetical protein